MRRTLLYVSSDHLPEYRKLRDQLREATGEFVALRGLRFFDPAQLEECARVIVTDPASPARVAYEDAGIPVEVYGWRGKVRPLPPKRRKASGG